MHNNWEKLSVKKDCGKQGFWVAKFIFSVDITSQKYKFDSSEFTFHHNFFHLRHIGRPINWHGKNYIRQSQNLQQNLIITCYLSEKEIVAVKCVEK